MTRFPAISRRSLLKSALVAGAGWTFPAALVRAAGFSGEAGAHELRADVLVVGGSFGGVAAALAAARMGRQVILTEECEWIGGQATAQGIPLDEHPWCEDYGRTQSYAEFRRRARDFYRRNFPLSDAARADPLLNPGAGWVSPLCIDPRVALAVLHEMLAPHLASGRLRIFQRHRPTVAHTEGDTVRAVTLRDERSGLDRTISASYILDGTELGDLLELAKVEHVIGAEAQRDTGEPLAADLAEPLDQMVFTHVFALDHLPGEEHVIAKPRDYDRWRNARDSRGGDKPKFSIPDLFGEKHDHFGRPILPGQYRTRGRRRACRVLPRAKLPAAAGARDGGAAVRLRTAAPWSSITMAWHVVPARSGCWRRGSDTGGLGCGRDAREVRCGAGCYCCET